MMITELDDATYELHRDESRTAARFWSDWLGGTMSKTKIEWTDRTWNPVTGCSWASPACDHCYAKRMSRRLAGRFGYPEAPHNFDVTLHHNRLSEPYKWRKPSMVFVVSMGDLFHDDVPYLFQERVLDTIARNQKHTFQLLTKRPNNARRFFESYGDAPSNVWFGVTIEDQQRVDERMPVMDDIPARIKFVSIEPLLGQVDLYGYFPDWIIVGGETGPGARKMLMTHALDLRDYAIQNSIPFFFKGRGTAAYPKTHYMYKSIQGLTYEQFPE